jgi:hypothetical protein
MNRCDYVSALCAVFAASITPRVTGLLDVVPVVHFLLALLSEKGEDTLYVKSVVLVGFYIVSVGLVPSARPLTPAVFLAADFGYAVWHLSSRGGTSVGGALAVVVSGALCGVHVVSWRRRWTSRPAPPT